MGAGRIVNVDPTTGNRSAVPSGNGPSLGVPIDLTLEDDNHLLVASNRGILGGVIRLILQLATELWYQELTLIQDHNVVLAQT